MQIHTDAHDSRYLNIFDDEMLSVEGTKKGLFTGVKQLSECRNQNSVGGFLTERYRSVAGWEISCCCLGVLPPLLRPLCSPWFSECTSLYGLWVICDETFRTPDNEISLMIRLEVFC